jgi:hypothetical protein
VGVSCTPRFRAQYGINAIKDHVKRRASTEIMRKAIQLLSSQLVHDPEAIVNYTRNSTFQLFKLLGDKSVKGNCMIVDVIDM